MKNKMTRREFGATAIGTILASALPAPFVWAADPDLFYEISSYGTRMIDAMLRVVGVAQLVYGSDRPVVEPAAPALGPATWDALVRANPARLLAA